MRTQYYLPNSFETFLFTKYWRKLIKKAIKKIPPELASEVTMPSKCLKGSRCKSGFCPTCIRNLRRRLLKFTIENRLYEREWHLVTVLVDGWTKNPGDFSQFGELKKHPIIKRFLLGLHRLRRSNLFLIGSIETVFKVKMNTPAGKPFHLHMLISGLTKKEIGNQIKRRIPLSEDRVPVRIDAVGNTKKDFIDTASYVVKQTFWRQSKSKDSGSGWLQKPKENEFAELMCNLGTHNCGDRFFFIGMKYHYGKFSLT